MNKDKRIKKLEEGFSKLLMFYEQQLELSDQNMIDNYPEVIAARKALRGDK